MSANASASTGLRNDALVAWKTALTGGVLNVYAGSVPASADAALGSATLLVAITGPSLAGLQFAATPVGGVLAKSAAQVWAGVAVAAGTATFYRLVGSTDSGVLSTTEKRLQGPVGVSGASLNFTAGTTMAIGDTKTIDSFATEIPTN